MVITKNMFNSCESVAFSWVSQTQSSGFPNALAASTGFVCTRAGRGELVSVRTSGAAEPTGHPGGGCTSHQNPETTELPSHHPQPSPPGLHPKASLHPQPAQDHAQSTRGQDRDPKTPETVTQVGAETELSV